jgi:hypothetical protein
MIASAARTGSPGCRPSVVLFSFLRSPASLFSSIFPLPVSGLGPILRDWGEVLSQVG